jgi:uncharacterized cofD-like protein
MSKKVPIKVYDEEGKETTKEVLYESIMDEKSGMVQWHMVPGQDLSGQKLRVNPKLRLVSIGGGTGQPIVLKGLKHYLFSNPDKQFYESSLRERLSAIVTMTDDGGSSGRLRDQLNVLPPGDIRNCLIGLSENESLMTQILQYRFEGENGLAGHNLGNLILAALNERNQDFFKAVTDISSVLAVQGQILPSTNEYAVIRAELSDGSLIEGETRINTCTQPIKRVMIEPEDVRPLDESISALEKADGIIIGPGSLYTSILPNLMIQGIADAIQRSSAVTILVLNLMTEPEETRGFTAGDHLRVIQDHVGYQIIDHALINNRPLPDKLLSRYQEDGAETTRFDLEEIQSMGINPVQADLLSKDEEKVRHDPDRLARQILRLLQQ